MRDKYIIAVMATLFGMAPIFIPADHMRYALAFDLSVASGFFVLLIGCREVVAYYIRTKTTESHPSRRQVFSLWAFCLVLFTINYYILTFYVQPPASG